MEARPKTIGKKEFFDAYLSQINWDWLFLRGQIIFAAIFLTGLLGFVLWFVQ